MRCAQNPKKNEGIWFKHDGNQIIRFLINHMFTTTYHISSSPKPILGRVLDLEILLHPIARLGRTAAGGVDPINLLHGTPIAPERLLLHAQGCLRQRIRAAQFQPGDGFAAVFPDVPARFDHFLGDGDLGEDGGELDAVVVGVGVQVEGRGRAGEVMLAGDEGLGGEEGRVAFWGGDREGGAGELGHDEGGEAGDAGCVVEGCAGAGGDGNGVGIVGVTGVVLGAAADGDVVEG